MPKAIPPAERDRPIRPIRLVFDPEVRRIPRPLPSDDREDETPQPVPALATRD